TLHSRRPEFVGDGITDPCDSVEFSQDEPVNGSVGVHSRFGPLPRVTRRHQRRAASPGGNVCIEIGLITMGVQNVEATLVDNVPNLPYRVPVRSTVAGDDLCFKRVRFRVLRDFDVRVPLIAENTYYAHTTTRIQVARQQQQYILGAIVAATADEEENSHEVDLPACEGKGTLVSSVLDPYPPSLACRTRPRHTHPESTQKYPLTCRYVQRSPKRLVMAVHAIQAASAKPSER